MLILANLYITAPIIAVLWMLSFAAFLVKGEVVILLQFLFSGMVLIAAIVSGLCGGNLIIGFELLILSAIFWPVIGIEIAWSFLRALFGRRR